MLFVIDGFDAIHAYESKQQWEGVLNFRSHSYGVFAGIWTAAFWVVAVTLSYADISEDSAICLAGEALGLSGPVSDSVCRVTNMPLGDEWQEVIDDSLSADTLLAVHINGIVLDAPGWPRDVVARNNPRRATVIVQKGTGRVLTTMIEMERDTAGHLAYTPTPMSMDDFARCLAELRCRIDVNRKPRLTPLDAALAAAGIATLRTTQIFVSFVRIAEYHGEPRHIWIAVGYDTPCQPPAGPGSFFYGPCEVAGVDDESGETLFLESCPRFLRIRFSKHSWDKGGSGN